ncbi:MAG: flagellar basal body L-ring protein FlgH [Candidatus Zixiibacteriota bacterium]
MKASRILLFILILLLLPFAFKGKGQDFGQSQSLFSDIKAHKVGDVLTVLIYEQNQASNQVQTKTEKSNDASTKGGPGVGPLLRFIPAFSMDAESEVNFNGKGQNLRNGSLRARMSVTVVGVKDNGDLIIEGSRVLGISHDRETISLSGVVRTKDVSPDNTVNSYQIADAEIKYTGKGNVDTGTRPGWFARLVSWFF